MGKWRDSWTVYSVGLLTAWVIVLALTFGIKGAAGLKNVSLVFFGYFIGWLSATIKVNLMRKHQTSRTNT